MITRTHPRRHLPPAPHRASRFPAVLAAVLLIAATVATVLVLGGGRDGLATAPVRVAGSPLPAFDGDPADDPAVGRMAPTFEGTMLDGEPGWLAVNGRPTILVVLAHWCSHCNADLDTLLPYLETNPLEDIDLIALSTFADPAREHYPPTTWLERRGWRYPTLLDSDDSAAAAALGARGTPFWVALRADGSVAWRWSGELGVAGFEALVERLQAA